MRLLKLSHACSGVLPASISSRRIRRVAADTPMKRAKIGSPTLICTVSYLCGTMEERGGAPPRTPEGQEEGKSKPGDEVASCHFVVCLLIWIIGRCLSPVMGRKVGIGMDTRRGVGVVNLPVELLVARAAGDWWGCGCGCSRMRSAHARFVCS